jgi:pimeloyl-ACP methyl ester carboxylesterase
MYRTRFKRQIVAEFLPPLRPRQRTRVIILCDGMPSIPRKQPLMEFLSQQGFWTIYPRWRGTWESDGQFLAKSPHLDILDIIDELPRGMRDSAFGQRFPLSPDDIFVIGGSFGGAAAILCSLDRRVTKVIANCPVVDWSILREEQRKETSNPSYPAYIREAFGSAYRLTDRNWNKLFTGRFFNPAHHADDLRGSKIMMFHAKDDPYIPWKLVRDFAHRVSIDLTLLPRGGHLRTEETVRKHWRRILAFFNRRERLAGASR